MFPQNITEWLDRNTPERYSTLIAKKRPSTTEHLLELGISPYSDIGYFYLNYGSFSVRGWYELLEIEAIKEGTQYAYTALGVPTNYLALTGIEGQGIVLYELNSGVIFDVEYGEFEQLTSGVLAPIASSFTDYLQWCKSKSECLE